MVVCRYALFVESCASIGQAGGQMADFAADRSPNRLQFSSHHCAAAAPRDPPPGYAFCQPDIQQWWRFCGGSALLHPAECRARRRVDQPFGWQGDELQLQLQPESVGTMCKGAAARFGLGEAGVAVLRGDKGKVVQIVEKNILQLSGGRFDVPWHGEIDQEKRTRGAATLSIAYCGE